MPESHKALVEEMFAARDRGMEPIEAIQTYLDPAIEWVDGVVTKSTVRGHAGFIEAMANLEREGYDAASRPEAVEELGSGAVIASGYTRLTRGDSYTDLPAYWAFEIHEGKIVRGGSATRRDEALAAIGRSD